MNWFPGPFALACQVSKKNKALLLVYIDDDGENNQQMKEFLDSITSSLFTCPYVAVHLKNTDPAYKTWTAQNGPTTYLVDENSTILKTIKLENVNSKENFEEQLKDIIKNFTNKNAPQPQIVSASSSSLAAPPGALPNSSTANTSELSLNKKIERAKELLEKKRLDDAEKKRQEEKEKEMERIRSAKLMKEAAQQRQEKEMIEAATQRRREKIAAEAEKERVRQQIIADREEREYRMNRGAPVKPETVESPQEERKIRVESDRCRVQIRLPDNNTFFEEFSATEKLGSLMNVIQESGQVTGPFVLVQPFPRHQFTEEEMEKTFIDLYLTPSCTLVVELLNKRGSSQQLATSNPLQFLSYLFTLLILSPLSVGYQWIRNLMGMGSSEAETTKKKEPEGSKGNRRSEPGGEATVRRRGNITGLHNPNGNDSEDNANWNGNSTQFM